MVTSLNQLFDMRGRAACVTGAASGIGRATALLLAELGASIHAADIDADGLERLARECAGLSTHVYDQAKLTSIDLLAEAVGPVDILVNNAGILLYEPLLDVRWEDMNRVVQVNLVGSMALTKLFGQRMVERRHGAVVMIGSQLAFNGSEFRSVYAATKAGISQFVKTAALEWGRHGVRVNCVAPGRTLTAINRHLLTDPSEREQALARIPLGRFGEPDDIARAIAFLASDAASYITGHTLVVDGGWILP
jgi:NAD(P)-dependent dehydrogenase (short-subunit alcohol dehydrogenase family)